MATRILAGTEFSCLLSVRYWQSVIEQKIPDACDPASRQWTADADVENSVTGTGCCCLVVPGAPKRTSAIPGALGPAVPGSGILPPANDDRQPVLFLYATGGFSWPFVRVTGNGFNKG